MTDTNTANTNATSPSPEADKPADDKQASNEAAANKSARNTNTENTTTENKSTTEKPTPIKPARKRSPHKKSSARHTGSFGTWLVVLLVIIGAAGVWQISSQDKQQQQQLADIKQQLAATLQSQNKLLEQQAERNTRYEQAITRLKESLDTLLQNNRHLRRDWLLAEAEYLIKLANHRLILMRDVNTSIKALQSADDRLREVGDPTLIHLRQEILNDIQSLKAVPQVDTVGLALTLNAMAKQIPQLPLRTGAPTPSNKQDATASDSAASSSKWADMPAAMWEDIKGMFVIRHHDQDVQKLLSPEQKFFLTQNILLQLEQARLAVMNAQDEIYHDRLASIRTTIGNYFDVNADATKGLLDTLNHLDQASISPGLPDISGSLKQFTIYHNDGTSSVPESVPESVPSPAPGKPAAKTKAKTKIKRGSNKTQLNKTAPPPKKPQDKQQTKPGTVDKNPQSITSDKESLP